MKSLESLVAVHTHTHTHTHTHYIFKQYNCKKLQDFLRI